MTGQEPCLDERLGMKLRVTEGAQAVNALLINRRILKGFQGLLHGREGTVYKHTQATLHTLHSWSLSRVKLKQIWYSVSFMNGSGHLT